MRYLIDGHNLIPKLGISLRDIDDENQLIRILGEFCRQTRAHAEIFFDKAPPGFSGTTKHGVLTIHYVHERRTADDAIRSRLRRLGNAARNWAVVSSDREVQAAARRARAAVISSEHFARQIRQSRPSDAGSEKPSPNDDDVDMWLKIFGG